MKNKLMVLMGCILSMSLNAQGNLAEDYSISKKANVSNNFNTGKIGISIPLYTIDLGTLLLQSSLNYKQEIPKGEPSIVGTNWDFNLFGKIIVAHANTEKLVFPYVLLNGASDGYNTPLESQGMPGPYCMVKEVVYPSKYNIINSPNAQNTKYNPNTYYFDFFGYSGYMVYDNTGKFIVHCEQADLKADFSGNKCYNQYQPVSSIPEIIMKDDKGNEFYFGGDYNTADIYYGNVRYDSKWYGSSNPGYYTNCHTNYISSLYLKKAVLANGRTIEGFYKQGNKSIMDPFVNGGVYYKSDYPNGIPSKTDLLNNNIFLGVDDAIEFDKTSMTGYNGGEVNERYTNATIYQKIAVLDSIKVSDYGTVNFNYSQLYNKLTKPFLTGVQVKRSEKNSRVVNFNYMMLNNSTYLQTLTNNGDQYNFSYYTDFGNPNTTTGGLLKSVMYPTKGTETFEYEQNKISKRYEYSFSGGFTSEQLKYINTPTDGFRVKSIKKTSENNNYTKNYYYTDETFNESGIQTFYTSGSSTDFTFTSLSSTTFYKGKFDDYVRYSRVTEEIEGKEKTRYYFTDLITNPDSTSSFSTLKINKNNERGKLFKMERFDKDNTLVYTQDTKYTNFLKNVNPISEISPICVNCKITDDRFYIRNGSGISYLYQPVLPYLPLSVKTKEKVGNQFSETIQNFKYNTSYLYWHSNPIEEKTETLGKTTISKTYYPGDILRKNQACVTGNCPSDTDVVGEKFSTYKQMIAGNTNYPIITTQTNASGKTSLSESIYKKNNTSGNILLLDKIKTSLNSSSVDNDIYTQAQVANKENFELYDSRGNLIQSRLENEAPTTTIWGYNQTLPIAKIKGITYSEIMNSLGLDGNDVNSYLQLDIVKKSNKDTDTPSEQSLFSALQHFRNLLAGYQVTTYTYDPLIGTKSVTSPSGSTEFYTYDAQNRFDKVLDLNSNIIKEYTYNYKSVTKHLNEQKGKTFTRETCNAIQIPGVYTYVVWPGTYSSYFSQDEANTIAQHDIDANGQKEANIYGGCTYMPFDCTISVESAYSDMSSSFFNKVTNIGYDVYSGTICFNTKGHNWGWPNQSRKIGKINGICRPRTFKTVDNPFGFGITIYNNGDIYATWNNTFSNAEPNKTIIISFAFPYDK